MSAPTPEINAEFSDPSAGPTPWADVTEVLSSSEMFWLSTVRSDGRPHVTPLPAIWHDGALHICTGDGEQKSKNLQANPSCVLTTDTPSMTSGLDVVLEGSAVRVTSRALLEQLAALWKSELDWDFQVLDDHFSDGSHGEGWVYRVAPTKVLAFAKSPYAQTRFVF